MIKWTDKPVKGGESWTGVRKADIIELRKTFTEHPHYSQVLIVVRPDGVTMSMNGKAAMSIEEFTEVADVIYYIRGLQDE